MKSKATSMRRNYALACGALLLLLGFASYQFVEQSRAHATAMAEALYHEDVRTALWRMETRVGSLMASTAIRRQPSFEEMGLSNSWIAPKTNEVRDIDAPDGELRAAIVDAADQAYAVARQSVPFDVPPLEPQQVAQAQGVEARGVLRSQDAYSRRALNSNLLQVVSSNVQPSGEAEWRMGPLAPVWHTESGSSELYLARRVESPEGVAHESYKLQWSELEELLLTEVQDLFPEARLLPAKVLAEPVAAGTASAADAFRLAAIPVRLEADPVVKPTLQRGPLVALGLGWLALLAAMGFGWVALSASIAFGQKHKRFTHAVTHELRTPLTTFRMYSEMLSREMVPEDSKAEYLATLESEAVRLSGLVENVLRYAKLEEGGPPPEQESLTMAALMDRLVPGLDAQCARSGATLDWNPEGIESNETTLTTDPGAVQQILTNLVENACKYGGDGAVVLRAAAASDRCFVEVRDSGPGVPERHRTKIFEPFERAGRDGAEEAPGVGLGLALSRDLARELGGDLTLEPSSVGAVFRLSLPH